MRPRNEAARERLDAALARLAPAAASALAEALGVSVPTLHRLLDEAQPRLLSAGRARRTRYALRRALRGEVAPQPVYEIDADGRASLLGSLSLVQPEGSLLDLGASDWPLPDDARDGWWAGLPYPLQDMRPQGYLGRQLARAEHARLELPPDPTRWRDDEVLHALRRIGDDTSGNLVFGDPAFERWQAATLAPPPPIAAQAVGPAYVQLAEQAIAAGVPGSSAAGEFPKFPARRERAGSATPQVLVKFSGADGSPAVQRWSDLLVCEHLALETLAAHGLPAAASRIVQHAGRTFLEVERFDRHGDFGRSRLVCLATVDATWLGDGSSDWPRLAARLAELGLLAPAEVARIERLWWFGRLIANTDMHPGNLSFRPRGGLALAPAYDMLPMLFAPLAGGELPVREFAPPLPLPLQRAAWGDACRAAMAFWAMAARDPRIGDGFRAVCMAEGEQLAQVAERA